ncbi:putative ribonuclease H protein [Nymphaea thermarum]|nr:putative ribonuclease H protein [Nymphaea thermarum]
MLNDKSSLVCFNVSTGKEEELAHIGGWRVARLPMTNLGLPLFAGKMIENLCSSLVLKFERKLSQWKGQLLSYTGRLCLIKHNVSSLLVYGMLALRIPKFVLDRLDRSMASFLWADKDGKKDIRQIPWKTLKNPMEEGGVSLKSLEPFSVGLLASRLCITFNNNSLRAVWIDRKRFRKGQSLDPQESMARIMVLEQFWNSKKEAHCGQLAERREAIGDQLFPGSEGEERAEMELLKERWDLGGVEETMLTINYREAEVFQQGEAIFKGKNTIDSLNETASIKQEKETKLRRIAKNTPGLRTNYVWVDHSALKMKAVMRSCCTSAGTFGVGFDEDEVDPAAALFSRLT